MARHSLASYSQHKNQYSCPYDSQRNAYQYLWQQPPLTQHSCVTQKVTRSGVPWKSCATISSSAGTLTLSEITTEHRDNSWPAQLVHSFINIFVLNLHWFCTAKIAHLGKTQLQQFVICTAGNVLAVAAIRNMYTGNMLAVAAIRNMYTGNMLAVAAIRNMYCR